MGLLPSPTVLRFSLTVTDQQDIGMPVGARPLSVSAAHLGVGPNAPVRIDVWVHCDPEQPYERRRFRVVGTGGHAGNTHPADFIGTAITDHGGRRGVWHVFDCGRTADAS